MLQRVFSLLESDSFQGMYFWFTAGVSCLCQSLEDVEDPDSTGLTGPPPLPPKPDPVLLKNHLAALEGGWTCGGSSRIMFLEDLNVFTSSRCGL